MTATFSAYTAQPTEIIKSPNDKRDYAYSELENGLKLLVISDPTAQRAAAAVDVNVGSSAEPDTFPGLAHFLEHMLFLGTDKYPDPDDYINYISDHGGHHNAFTAFEHTNYFFDIDPAYLHGGLQRFSRFFIAPTLAGKYVERERNAVDSEYQSKLREDPWRNMDTLKQAVNPKHPYARFSIGNNATLPGDTVREALLTFYQTYYSAERMSVIIIGKEDTNTLSQWGKALFTDVPKRAKTDVSIPQTLFDGITLPIEIRNTSINNEKNLSLAFHFPYRFEDEYNKALGYLSYCLGYEGEGSLLAALKQRGYASELYAGAGHRIGDENSFEIGVQLTDKGLTQPHHVIAMIFAYIDLLRQDEQGASRYQEIATMAETAFKFKEKHNAIHEVSSLARRLNRFPVKDILALNAIFSGYQKVRIDSYLKHMTADNSVIQITAPTIFNEADEKNLQTTPYFKVPYQLSAPKPQVLTTIDAADKDAVAGMHLPKANPFIADNFALQKDKITHKQEILANGVQLFYNNDTRFNVPRSSVQIALQSALDLTITDKTAMSLLAGVIDEQLTTTLYDADVAGVDVKITAGEKSLAIALNGYQQKMADLLSIILKELNRHRIDPAIFQQVKADYRQDLENMANKMPYQQTFPYVNAALVTDASLPSQRLAVLDDIDAEKVAAFAEKYLASLAVRMLVYGNHTYAQAQALGANISQALPKSRLHNPWQNNQAKVLNKDKEVIVNVNHNDSAITYYIQADKDYLARAEIGLLAKMIEPQFFTKLRTEMQLGYVVFAYPHPVFNQAGIAFTIQSPVADADSLQKHIGNFNRQFSKSLATLNEADFQAVKTILQAELLQQPENLLSAAERYWLDILTTGKTASSRQAIADAINDVTLDTFVKKMTALLTKGKTLLVKATAKKAQ